MVISYALIAAVGYYYVGATVGSPITSELPSIGAANTVVNVLLFCHVTVAYVESGEKSLSYYYGQYLGSDIFHQVSSVAKIFIHL